MCDSGGTKINAYSRKWLKQKYSSTQNTELKIKEQTPSLLHTSSTHRQTDTQSESLDPFFCFCLLSWIFFVCVGSGFLSLGGCSIWLLWSVCISFCFPPMSFWLCEHADALQILCIILLLLSHQTLDNVPKLTRLLPALFTHQLNQMFQDLCIRELAGQRAFNVWPDWFWHASRQLQGGPALKLSCVHENGHRGCFGSDLWIKMKTITWDAESSPGHPDPWACAQQSQCVIHSCLHMQKHLVFHKKKEQR